MREHLPIISPDRLPSDATDQIFGRAVELKLLNACWDDPYIYLLEIHAMGGAGKTALVRHWLDGLAVKDYDGAQRIYTWSFYSQGAGDHRQSTAEPFIVDMLRWFGEDATQLPLSPTDRARRLAEHIRRQRTLLILDGVEPLQYPPGGPEAGKLKDPGLAALLRALAAQNNGLCILTTRMAVTDVTRYDLKTLRRWPLEKLDDKAGADLLTHLGVRGKRADLEKTTRDYKGHALALRLLGNYLREVYGGDLSRRDRIRKLTSLEQEGKHAQHVMAAYVNWFEQNAKKTRFWDKILGGKKTTSIELSFLLLTGLFDRPAPVEALDALLSDPMLDLITTPLKNASPEQQTRTLNHLVSLSLLSSEKDDALGTQPAYLPGLEGIAHLDAHPLVREFFGEKIENDYPKIFRKAHAVLYKYYKSLPQKHYNKDLPDTLEEMEPLYAAVMHGCLAGKKQEALYEVYYDRIRRKDKSYSLKKLGAFGSDLTAMALFFKRHWDIPSENLTKDAQSFVFNAAGFDLRGLARLREAAQVMEQHINFDKKRKYEFGVAITGCNLSELYLASGDVRRALQCSRESVEYADRSKDGFQMHVNRCTYAEVLHAANEISQATMLFEEAEMLQLKRQPEYQYLIFSQNFKYCDLLLSQTRYTEVLKRMKFSIEMAKRNNLLLDIACANLTIGKTYTALYTQKSTAAHHSVAKRHLYAAVVGLEKAGMQEFIPLGLLARAIWHRITKNYSAAEQDLAAVLEIVEPGGMRLHLVDYHIEMARLRKATPDLNGMGNAEWHDAEWHKAEALRLIEETGYKRRLKEAGGL